MDVLTYKIIHIIALLGLFSALGGLVAADITKPARLRVFTIAHGISLLLLFISGFGLQAKGPGYSFGSTWLIAKLVIWALLGASLVILKRRLIPAGAAWMLTIVLGAVAAYFAVHKPGTKMKPPKAPEQSLVSQK
ncbi:MAG: hypothetical protein ACN4GG_05855 [Akkermansiaceae bacterium]